MKKTLQQGFTLVELAIVLVIIGLIVGGVLVGQDLIKAAEIRTVVTDIESYNSAANTFRTKYNGYPGDLLASKASQFGLTNVTTTAGNGDGNGILENVEGAGAVATGAGGENILFWVHLSQAGLIKDGFASAEADGEEPGAIAAAAIGTVLPATRLRESAFYHAYGENGRNFFHVGGFGAVTAVTGAVTAADQLSNLEAYNLDEKIDDAVPTTGTVFAMTDIGEANVDPGGDGSAATQCVNEGAAAGGGANIDGDEFYILDEVTLPGVQNAVNCQIRVRASF